MTTRDEIIHTLAEAAEATGLLGPGRDWMLLWTRMAASRNLAELLRRADEASVLRELVRALLDNAETVYLGEQEDGTVATCQAMANADMAAARAALATPATDEGRVAALEGALDELMGLRTEHGLNCFVAEDIGCVCGMDQALEGIMDVRLGFRATPATDDAEPDPTALIR